MSSTEDSFRANLRRDLIAAGGDPVLADEVIDLSIHAAKSAIETLKATVMRGSCPGVRLGCFGVAPSLLASFATAMEQHFDTVTAAAGLQVESFTVGEGM